MRGTLARNWWVALAVLAGIGEVLFGIALALQDRNAGAYAGGAVIATAGLVVLGGVAWRRRSRIVGDLLIAVGVLPLLPFWWMVAPTLLALVVLIAATLDAADARSLGRSARPVGAGGKTVLAVLAAVLAAVVAAVVIGAGGPFLLLGVALLVPVVALVVWVGRRPRRAV